MAAKKTAKQAENQDVKLNIDGLPAGGMVTPEQVREYERKQRELKNKPESATE